MIRSMTGFATASIELDTGSMMLELRSVNHRYLDLQIRLPDELRIMEATLRETLSAQLSRGKVECRVNFHSRQSEKNPTEIDSIALLQLARWSREIQKTVPDARSLSVGEILRWDGILRSTQLADNVLQSAVMMLARPALEAFNEGRAREGEKLGAFLLQRTEQIEKLCAGIAPRIPIATVLYEEKLRQRLQSIMQGGDEDRLHQEIALFANKIDINEELSRLRAHLAEVGHTLTQGGAVGKRLDFLMQELHREANTLGSKAVEAEVSRASMEMKLLIEQMREQVQNLE